MKKLALFSIISSFVFLISCAKKDDPAPSNAAVILNTPSFTYEESYLNTLGGVYFTNNSVAQPTSVTYVWDFGDGITKNGSLAGIHYYNFTTPTTIKQYTVKLHAISGTTTATGTQIITLTNTGYVNFAEGSWKISSIYKNSLLVNLSSCAQTVVLEFTNFGTPNIGSFTKTYLGNCIAQQNGSYLFNTTGSVQLSYYNTLLGTTTANIDQLDRNIFKISYTNGSDAWIENYVRVP